MRSIVRSPKDFCAGLLYLAIGLAAVYLGRDFPMGTALKMGPAFFPTVLGWLLAFVGVLALGRSVLRKGEPIPRFAWKPLLLISAATVVFGLTVRGAGLAIALPVFVVMTSLASARFRWSWALVLAAVATVFCSLVFVKGLGVPIPLVGRWFGPLLGN